MKTTKTTEDDLDSRATLAVEAKRASHAFHHSQINVGVGQNNGRVLGLKAKTTTQPVRARMRPLQRIGRLRRPDEREDVNLVI